VQELLEDASKTLLIADHDPVDRGVSEEKNTLFTVFFLQGEFRRPKSELVDVGGGGNAEFLLSSRLQTPPHKGIGRESIFILSARVRGHNAGTEESSTAL
jgi:hypothetical protein